MKIIKPILLLLIALIGYESFGTHIRGGFLTAKKVDGFDRTYQIKFVGWRDTDSGIVFGGGRLNFGDGELVDNQFVISEEQITKNIVRAEFTIAHTFTAPGTYIISYEEDFRNNGITNVPNSLSTSFRVELTLLIDPFITNNNLPVLMNDPIFEVIANAPHYQRLHLFDADSDLLEFKLIVPKGNSGTEIGDYLWPNDSSLSSSAVLSSYAIDKRNGTIFWKTPGNQFNMDSPECPDGVSNCAEYLVAYEVSEWRMVNGEKVLLSKSILDFNLFVIDQNLPQLTLPQASCIGENETYSFGVLDEDAIGYKLAFDQPHLIATLNNDLMHNSDMTYSGSQDFSLVFDKIQGVQFVTTSLLGTSSSGEEKIFSSFGITLADDCPDIDLLNVPELQPKISIYPNPVTNNNLQWRFKKNVHTLNFVIIHSVDGKMILKKELKPGNTSLSLPSGFENGLYFVRFTNDQGRYTESKRVLIMR